MQQYTAERLGAGLIIVKRRSLGQVQGKSRLGQQCVLIEVLKGIPDVVRTNLRRSWLHCYT